MWSNFWIFANLTDEKRHLSVVLMSNSRIMSKVGHLFLNAKFVFLSNELTFYIACHFSIRAHCYFFIWL